MHQVNDIDAVQEVQVFLGFRGPETHFIPAHGHLQPAALFGAINLLQITNDLVYKVERQGTDETRKRKPTNWFSEVIKEIFHHNFQVQQTGRPK